MGEEREDGGSSPAGRARIFSHQTQRMKDLFQSNQSCRLLEQLKNKQVLVSFSLSLFVFYEEIPRD